MFCMLGSIADPAIDRFRRADLLVQFAIFPGGFIVGGIIYLINGCVECYADILPPKYRARVSSLPQWQSTYDSQQIPIVESALKRFALSHGFRETDAFQFRPEDRIGEMLRDFYPGRVGAKERTRLSGSRYMLASADGGSIVYVREYVDLVIQARGTKA